MKLCLRIALLVACLVGWAVTQEGFDLSDAFDDDPKPTPKPPPEKPKVNADAGGGGGELDLSDAFGPEEPEPEKPKKPAAGDNDNDMGFDLADALGPDPNPKPDPPAVVPPKSGEGGGSFDDSDLMGVGEGDYKPDGGRGAGGRGAVDPADNAADQPQDLYLLWGRVLTMLNANMPDEVHIWIANVKEVMKPLLERAMELLETIQ